MFAQKCYAEENGTDNGNYEFTIPSEISVSQKDNKLEGTIPISVTTHNRKWLSVNIESENNFNLVGKTDKQKLPYQLSKTSFDFNPQYDIDNNDATTKQEIALTFSGATTYADDYSDKINFIINTYDTRTIVLDCNGGNVNGQSEIKYTVKDGQTYGQLPRPNKSGSAFVSWTDQKGNSIYSGSQVSSDTEKLTAKWSQIFSIAIHSIVNGKLGSYFRNCGKAELYINGEKYTENQEFLYCDNLKEGDTFKIDNIRATDGYIYTGFNCSKGTNDSFTFEYYDNGLVKSVSGIFTISNIQLYFDFESDSTLQRLIRKYSLDTIVIDSNMHSSDIAPVGVLGLFTSNAAYYIDESIMHIYNPDGGKVIAPESLEGIFTSITIKHMDLKGLDTSNVKSLVNCFAQDYWLETLDVSNWNTSNLIDGSNCFWNTTSLQSLDLSNWDTSNLKYADSMIAYTGVSDLSSIENWNVENIQRTSNMLSGNINVKSLDLSNWNTKSMTASNGMFWNLKNIEYLNVTGLDFSKCDNLGYTFGGMYKLKKITGLETLNFSNIRYFHTAFANLYEMEELNLPYINFDIVTYMNSAFANDYKLKSLTFDNFHITKDNYDMTETFRNCKSLEHIYTSTTKDTISYIPAVSTNMFTGCTSLVGGSGTTYDPTFVDATAARIDGGPNSPGYFTDIADKTLDETSETENDVDAIIEAESAQDDNIQEIQLEEIYNPELEEQQEE